MVFCEEGKVAKNGFLSKKPLSLVGPTDHVSMRTYMHAYCDEFLNSS